MGQLIGNQSYEGTDIRSAATLESTKLKELSISRLRKIMDGIPLKAAILLRMLGGLEYGCLRLTLPDGRTLNIIGKNKGPDGQITFNNWQLPVKLARNALIGIGESYIDGDWDSEDVTMLLNLVSANAKLANRVSTPAKLSGFVSRIRHWLNGNTKAGSKRNISAHYDLGNAFYKEWLDPSMTYSSAYFKNGAKNLEAAQRAKYANLAKLIGLKHTDHVLEIGCGWGGFAEYAAKEIGCKVTGLTISREQLNFARERMKKGGLEDRVTLKFQDYRDESGKFDKIVSIEMFEAVGEAWWETYYSQLSKCLKPGGVAGLQIITIANESFDEYRKRPDFIQRHVFPGGMLPSPDILSKLASDSGLTSVAQDDFGKDYAKTLALWREVFGEKWKTIKQLGFDERFKRLWDFYLHYCEAGFLNGNINVSQIALRKPT